jgi:hypothetical protein
MPPSGVFTAWLPCGDPPSEPLFRYARWRGNTEPDSLDVMLAGVRATDLGGRAELRSRLVGLNYRYAAVARSMTGGIAPNSDDQPPVDRTRPPVFDP